MEVRDISPSTVMPRPANWWIEAYRGRRVLVTGHTGFKGSWLSIWLARLGADVTGVALDPPTTPALFEQAQVGSLLRDERVDIRDRARLEEVWRACRPEIVFHLVAQPLVRTSYLEPLDTVCTNVLGTAHVLETARRVGSPVALVLVTSDKCYENVELSRGYHEDDQLGGRDVYSASKAAAEVLISSYRRSFFGEDTLVTAASARAGNVIGGGDWACDRLVPDAIRALAAGEPVTVRKPEATRPWQHVLEPLSGYLHLGAMLLAGERSGCAAWNFGPMPGATRTVAGVVGQVVEDWGGGSWRDGSDPDAPHEATLLELDISRAVRRLGWAPRFSVCEAIQRTVAWYRAVCGGAAPRDLCNADIADYEARPQVEVEAAEASGTGFGQAVLMISFMFA